MICYSTKLIGAPEDLESLRTLLLWERDAFNEASKDQYLGEKNSIVWLHRRFYRNYRNYHPEVPSQVIVRAENECISSYSSIKSNKHKIKCPIVKKNLSLRLDLRLYSVKEKGSINITTANKRKKFTYHLYPKLQELLDNYEHKSPLVFERNRELFISFPFDITRETVKPTLCLGVDLGCRVFAACSDGRLIIDKKFNGEKRKLRHLKSKLQSKGTKSAKRHLKKLRRKERNKNKNQTFLIANEILRTDANVIALENLKGIKAKKHKNQNKNRISQIPLFDLRQTITYKAHLLGKSVVVVNPAYSSQTDCITNKVEGERKGRRFYSNSGLVYDADLNAARVIGQRSKLPISQGFLLDGQGVVTSPIVCKSLA